MTAIPCPVCIESGGPGHRALHGQRPHTPPTAVPRPRAATKAAPSISRDDVLRILDLGTVS